jgi:hypothetical protein
VKGLKVTYGCGVIVSVPSPLLHERIGEVMLLADDFHEAVCVGGCSRGTKPFHEEEK